MGYADLGRLCELLAVSDQPMIEKLRCFVGDLYATPQHVIKHALLHGLPGDCAAELPMPNSVRCQRCGSSVNAVPCVLCSNATRKKRKLRGFTAEQMPLEPTTAAPGGAEKIEIMRLRVSRGESPFHPKDVFAFPNAPTMSALSPAGCRAA